VCRRSLVSVKEENINVVKAGGHLRALLIVGIGIALVTAGAFARATGGAVLAQESTPPATPSARQELRLDLSVDDPQQACTRIDSTLEVVPGDEFLVAVCLINAPEPPAVITYTVMYDDRVVLAPNVGECDGDFALADDLFATAEPGGAASIQEALDCNPDMNAGRTTFGGSDLGDNFDCTSGGVVEPWGNKPPPTGNAFNGGCISAAGPYRLAPTAPLAIITFRAESAGDAPLTPARVSIVGESGSSTGTCNPVSDLEMPCYGGIVSVSGEDPLDELEDDGDGTPWLRIAIGAGFALLFVGGVALWFLRPKRRSAA
jgi:hypothetical protein